MFAKFDNNNSTTFQKPIDIICSIMSPSSQVFCNFKCANFFLLFVNKYPNLCFTSLCMIYLVIYLPYFFQEKYFWQNGDLVAYQQSDNIHYLGHFVSFNKLKSQHSKEMCEYHGSYQLLDTSHLLQQAKSTIYPQVLVSSCTAMLLSDLGNPEWITVGCNEPVTSDIMCYFETKFNYTEPDNESKTRIYNKLCVLKNNFCYKFIWNQHKIPMKTGITSDIQFFQYLFDAVSVTFPPIVSSDLRYIITYKKYNNIYVYHKNKIREPTVEGLFVYKQNSIIYVRGRNVFKCKNKAIISTTLLCDGKADCQEEYPTDEIGCECKDTRIYSNNCKYIEYENNNRRKCSFLYFTSLNNRCLKYGSLFQVHNAYLEMLNDKFKVPKRTFSCNNTLHINDNLVNDLVPDCGLEAQDEFFLKAMANG